MKQRSPHSRSGVKQVVKGSWAAGERSAGAATSAGRKMLDRLKGWARTIKRDVHALYLTSRDPRVPSYAKALALLVAGYALSPIDLMPDFVPVLGYVDDVIIVPLGVWLVIRMIPPNIMAEDAWQVDRLLSAHVFPQGQVRSLRRRWNLCLLGNRTERRTF